MAGKPFELHAEKSYRFVIALGSVLSVVFIIGGAYLALFSEGLLRRGGGVAILVLGLIIGANLILEHLFTTEKLNRRL